MTCKNAGGDNPKQDMPRLTSQRYIEIHCWLRNYWLEDAAPYVYLTPEEQWNLHEFFQPCKQLSDDELTVHREAVTRRFPSLPQRAGRALKKFEKATEVASLRQVQSFNVQMKAGEYKRPASHGPITVRSLAQPEVDTTELARLLWDIARSNFKGKGDGMK
jgi:hypothetical protein